MPFVCDGVLAYPMSLNEQIQPDGGKSDGASATVAGLGLIAGLGALIGASCCILPLLLAIAGVGGSWVASIGALTPYQPYLLGMAALCVGIGWFVALRRRARARVVFMLGLATVLVFGSVLTAIYERPLTQYLFAIWRDG